MTNLESPSRPIFESPSVRLVAERYFKLIIPLQDDQSKLKELSVRKTHSLAVMVGLEAQTWGEVVIK
jgi:hypothetical protein